MLKLDEQELLAFVMRTFEWSNADVFAFGKGDRISRLGEIAAYIASFGATEGRPRAKSVKIVLPPAGGRDPEAMRADVKEGVRRAFRRFDPDGTNTAEFVENTYADLKIEQATDFDMASLDAVLGRTAAHEAVIVGEASHYRSRNVAVSEEGRRLPEDIWSAHLHAAMLLAEQRAEAAEGYIILDIGELFPARDANMDLLKSAGRVGLCGGSYENELSPEEMIAKVGEAMDAAAAGDIGRAISLVEGDSSLSELQKWMIRLTILERAGARDEASRMLDESTDRISKLKGENLLGVARIAAGIDRDDYAQDLIERALPDLVAANDLEVALQVAADTRRRPLIQRTKDRLRDLHPGSHLLRALDGREAAHEGDYERAAEFLEGSLDERERAVGAVFDLLARGLARHGLRDPARLVEELTKEAPDWKADIQREVILSLERADRRDDAVGLLLGGGIDWDEDWFMFARGLLARSLASGSSAVGPDALDRMINVAALYIAEYPAAGLPRTSVSDLLDADQVGMGGLAAIVMNVVARADQQADPVKGEDSDARGLDNIRMLPAGMRRVLEWLSAQGDGTIVPGRYAVPPDVLGEDPDEFLHSILIAVDGHAPDPGEASEEAVLRHFGTIAIAVAPLARNPDADLPIIRGTAVKAIVSGRPQLARDLAELILTVAGDRPERRRAALAAFADIYARVGRLREALLMLAAAFELPSSGTWRQMWEEQTVLLRVLRDVGLANQSILIAERLRRVSADFPGLEGYASRLDTLELHAQLGLRNTGEAAAWPTDRLLEAAIANGVSILEVDDEPLPAAILLRQLIDHAKEEGVDVPAAAEETLSRLNDRLAAPYRTLVAAAGRLTDVTTVASIAGQVESARYNDDVSYDLRIARTMGKRLARASVDDTDPEGFAYALELLGMQGVGAHLSGSQVKAAERLLAKPAEPLAAAIEIARLDIPIVGMAIDAQGLMLMKVDNKGASPPAAIGKRIFDPARLPEWRQAFPYGYSNDKLGDAFRDATARLAVPEMPHRAIILSGDLSSMPPNVLTVGGDLAGLGRSLATVPSLSWLKASLAAKRSGNGTAAAWIPIAAGGSYMDTLSLMAGEIDEVLAFAKITLHTQTAAPLELASADLAIIGAHGGLAEGNRYFRGLSDDQHQPADLRQLVDVLRASRVALLFVCSGGRLDQHPESGGTLGIAHKLLDKGLEAVIAPSWPIPFTMVRPWLRTFLERWQAGERVIDAYGAANAAVAAATSSDLSRSLAMALYGNPFVAR